MRKRVVAMLLAMAVVCSQFLVPAEAEEEKREENIMKTFYVSPDGDDSAEGTEAAPFQTLERAKQAVGEVNKDMTGDIVVYLADGVWELDETLTFGQEDSGTNRYYVRYEAAEGAEPVISGGTELDGEWELHDSEKGIYKTALDRDSKLRALYVNGERSYMAQTENAVAAQGFWGSYTIGGTSYEDYTWETSYKEDFENSDGQVSDAIQKFAKSGNTENAVLNIVTEDDGNGALQLAHTVAEDSGFEIPGVTYRNGQISFRIKVRDESVFDCQYGALHMHAASTEGNSDWGGVKLEPAHDTIYFQTCTGGASTGQIGTGTHVVDEDVWYNVKMMITDTGDYFTKIWTGEDEPEEWGRQDSYTGLNGMDKFFRFYAYKSGSQAVDVLIDDIVIESGTMNDGADELPEWAWNTGTKSDGLLYNQSDLPAITENIEDVEIENQQTWNKNTVCVREIADDGSGKWILKLQQPYGAIAQTPGWGVGLQGYGDHVIKNAYELLDQPGEFYFDRTGKTLYYIPRDGEDLSDASVVVPRLETVVSFEGNPQVSGDLTTAGEKTITGQTENIIFDGITIAHSDWNLQKVGDSYGKSTVQAGTVYTAFASENWHADMYRNLDTIPGAVEMEFAHNIRLLNGEIKLTGAEGVLLSNDVDGCEVTGNYIYQTGGGGVVVGNPQHVYENDSLEPKTYYYNYVPGDGKPEVIGDGAPASYEKYQNGTERVPRDVKVSNNMLVQNCTLFPSHCPITSFYTQNMEVSNNFIKDAAYSGMSIGWGWGNFDGTESGFTDWGESNAQGWSILPGYPTNTCFGNKIINNRIDTVMTILHDGGLIYTLGKQEGTEISGNYVKGSYNHGIYQDEGSACFNTIENNVISDIAGGSLYIPEYGRKHDLSYNNNYSDHNVVTLDRVDWYPNINITVENFHYIADSVWPKEASDIVQESGLTPEYRRMFAEKYEGFYGTTVDTLLPASASLQEGEPLVLNAWLDEADEIWLAPAGTTEFTDGNNMTMAKGNAEEINTKGLAGSYRLYVKTGDTYSEASEAIVKVEGSLGTKVLAALNSSGQYTADSVTALQEVYDRYLAGEADEAALQESYDSLVSCTSYDLYYDAPAEVEGVTTSAFQSSGFTNGSIVDGQIADNNGWHSADNTTDAYITIDLQKEQTVTDLMIAPRPGYPARMPKDCDIYVSDAAPVYNGSSVTGLDENDKAASVSFTTGGYDDTKVLSEGTSGRYVTIHVKNVQNDTCINVSEIAMSLLRDDSPEPYIAVGSIELDQTALTLKAGDEIQVNAAVSPENATIKDLTWTSSDEEVAEVDVSGKVTAVSEGEAIITAAAKNGVTSTCSVAVDGKEGPEEAVNKKTLEFFLDSAKALLADGSVDNCVQSVREFFDEAVAEGEAVMADENATREEVLNAAFKLMKAVHAVDMKAADKTDLEMAVELADMVNLESYVTAGQQEFTDALAQAEAVLADGNAMQAETDDAWDRLVDAMENLRMKADKSVLENLIREAESLDLSLYTEESAAQFSLTLASVQAVFADNELSVEDQQAVDSAAAELRSAKADLIPISETSGGEGQGGDNVQDPGEDSQGSSDDADQGENPNDNSSNPAADQAVKTGDAADLLPWLILVAVSTVISGAGIVHSGRKYWKH